MRVLAGEPEGELVEPGAAHDDGARVLESLHRRGRLCGHHPVEGRPAGCDPVFVVDEVFEADRSAGERAGITAARDDLIDFGGPGQCALLIDQDEGVELGLGIVGKPQ